MTDMEHDIYDRACTHWKKKFRIEKSMEGYDFNVMDRPAIIEEFWTDYFSGKPIYTEGGHAYEQRRLLGLHGPEIA